MNKPRNNMFTSAGDETLLLKNCLQCDEKLSERWFTREEQELLKNEDTKLFRDHPANWWTQIWGGVCPKCLKFYPKIFYKDYECEDISYQEEKQKYSKEKELAKKVTTALLPQQGIRIRFVKSYGKGSIESYSEVDFYGEGRDKDGKLEYGVLSILFSIELIMEKEKDNPGFFCEVIAHELAHASDEVRLNLDFDPYSIEFKLGCKTCGHPHPELGHDKIWHDKFDEFRERIKKENLVAGSGYSSLGKEFILKDDSDDTVLSPDGKRLRIKKISLKDYLGEAEKTEEDEAKNQNEQENQRESKNKNSENGKIAWIIFAIFGIAFFFSFTLWLWKRKSKNQRK